jgi:hypothetical protein
MNYHRMKRERSKVQLVGAEWCIFPSEIGSINSQKWGLPTCIHHHCIGSQASNLLHHGEQMHRRGRLKHARKRSGGSKRQKVSRTKMNSGCQMWTSRLDWHQSTGRLVQPWAVFFFWLRKFSKCCSMNHCTATESTLVDHARFLLEFSPRFVTFNPKVRVVISDVR